MTGQFHGLKHDNRKGRSFFREATAYRYLLHEGVCAAGVVPYCYGYTVIDQTEWKMPRKDDWLRPFRSDPNRPKVLVLEFLPCASQMTLRWTTPQTAQAAMDALNIIHRAGIIHDDIHPRNLLVLPEGRVVWIDFELAGIRYRHHYVTMKAFHDELELCWFWLYEQLVCRTCFSLLHSLAQPTVQRHIYLPASLEMVCITTVMQSGGAGGPNSTGDYRAFVAQSWMHDMSRQPQSR